MKKIFRYIFAFLSLAAIIFFCGKFSVSAMEKNWEEKVSNPEILAKYQKAIDKQTDTNYLVLDGAKLAKGNQPNCALINLLRATSLDPNYRDGWIWLGYVQLKTGATTEAIDSLKKAQTIDPINPQVYELLKVSYEKQKNTEMAQKMEEKYRFLQKM